MTWPIRGLTIALWFTHGAYSHLQAQALSISPVPLISTTNTEATATSPSLNNTSSMLDFSLLNWRMGLLSPYSQSTLTGSATTSTPPVGTTIPLNNNPYVGATIGMQGSLISTNSNSSNHASSTFPTITTVVPASGSSSLASLYFAPRFVSFADLTPNYGLNNTLIGNANQSALILTNLTGSNNSNTNQLFSVPEPSTLVLCGGLLMLAGYGWSRRRVTAHPPVEDAKAILMGETNESMSS